MTSADASHGITQTDLVLGTPVLSVSALRKEYGAVVALADANLELRAGEIHALVGENGSGKSTLVGMVSGTVIPTSGTILINGEPIAKHTPAASQALGAVTVFQDGTMLPELSVGQNLYIGTRRELRPAYRRIEDWAHEVLEFSGLSGIDPRTPTREVAPGDRQLIEIARAMFAKPALLMLDEATSALDLAGVDRVMELIVKAGERGSAVLFVTHRLGEVFRVAQNISIVRDGLWQGTMPATSVTPHELVNLMAGTTVDVEFPARPGVSSDAEIVLSAENLSASGVNGVSLNLRAGEILGIAGADGNGQAQLLAALGAVTPSAGRLAVLGQSVTSPSGAQAAGVVYLSGDRKKESLFQNLSVRENLNVAVLKQLRRGPFISKRAEVSHVNDAIDEFGIRVGSAEDHVSSLSGGNQQKVAISRALSSDPRVLLIQEPTQGVDVRSRMDIYRMLRDSANEGLAVAAVSSDAAELSGICDRIIVMSRGHVIAEIAGEGSTEDQIVGAFAVAGHVGDTDGLAANRTEEAPVRRTTGFRQRVQGAQDMLRLGVLAVILIALFIFASRVNGTFASSQNIYNILLLTLPILVLAVAQFSVLIIGGIDISVGATMGLSLVVLSFLASEGSAVTALVVSLILALVVGLAVGLINSFLIEGSKVAPVIATIATMGLAGGLALILRPTAGGLINFDMMSLLTYQVGPFPILIIVFFPMLLLGDWMIWRSGPGVRLRAVGLHPLFAQRLGISVTRTRIVSYLACGALAGFAGLVLASTVGTGDANAGNGFTLLAIAAPVLGGASLLGGRGSLIGCLLGALTLAMANTLVPMLGIQEAWSYMLVGLLSIVALLAYSSSRDGLSSLKSLVRRIGGA